MRSTALRRASTTLLTLAGLALLSVPGAFAQAPPGGAPGQPPPPVDLSISVSGGGSRAEEHDSQVFEVVVTNPGPGTALNVQVIISTPDEFDLDDTTDAAECATHPFGQGRMVCTYPALPPGELRLRFRGEFNNSGNATTRVFVESLNPDPDPSNNGADDGGTRVRDEDRDFSPSGPGGGDPDGDPSATCFGEPATITGTEGDDELEGDDGPDVIVGLGGNDVIAGAGGDDLICAGQGDDDVAGDGEIGGGKLAYSVGEGGGDDRIDGGDDNDSLYGDYSGQIVDFGDDGDDTLVGGAGEDELFGGSNFSGGVESLRLSALGKSGGDDTLLAEDDERDELDGEGGENTCEFDEGLDEVDNCGKSGGDGGEF